MAMSKGCTIALVVFAILVLLIIIGIVVVWINKDKIVEASIDYMISTAESGIVADLPPGYTEASVHRIMSALKEGIKNKQIDAQEAQRLANTFKDAMQDKKIDADEGGRILIMIVEALPPGTIPADSIPARPPVDSLSPVPDSL
jgi:hypothetical protein